MVMLNNQRVYLMIISYLHRLLLVVHPEVSPNESFRFILRIIFSDHCFALLHVFFATAWFQPVKHFRDCIMIIKPINQRYILSINLS